MAAIHSATIPVQASRSHAGGSPGAAAFRAAASGERQDRPRQAPAFRALLPMNERIHLLVQNETVEGRGLCPIVHVSELELLGAGYRGVDRRLLEGSTAK